MDYAPDYRGYTSDIGRMWPVDGRYSAWQRELYGFVLDYHDELLARIAPGRTPDEIMDGAAEAMRARIDATSWSRPHYRVAVEEALAFRGHLSHPVGMAVHDVGDYRGRPLEPGLVFAVDPMIWVPEERLYVRVEDTIAVTDDGIENLTGFVPRAMDDVERLQAEPGLLSAGRSAREAAPRRRADRARALRRALARSAGAGRGRGRRARRRVRHLRLGPEDVDAGRMRSCARRS